MEMSGEYRIPAGRDQVWEALNDPEILKACIPGCESLEKLSETEMSADVTAKVGPVKAKFKGHVTLENLNPPESYTIAGEGKGGVAGFAKGGADVVLAEDGEETILTYHAKAKVGGKLAQLGSRLIDSTAKKMADEFFNAFAEKLGGAVIREPDAVLAEAGFEQAVHEMEEVAHKVGEKVQEWEKSAEGAIRDTEEKLEMAAGSGRYGGAIAWALMLLGVLILFFLAYN